MADQNQPSTVQMQENAQGMMEATKKMALIMMFLSLLGMGSSGRGVDGYYCSGKGIGSASSPPAKYR